MLNDVSKKKARPPSHARALFVLMLYGVLGAAAICAGDYLGAYQMHRMDK